jgi:hydroxymethylpyrimidine/phosphomethylpyrimidine kinase
VAKRSKRMKYNVKKSAKKTSVKLNTKEGEQFSKLLTNHNKKIKDIERINSFILKSTKEMVENFQKNVLKTGNLSNQQKVAKELKENTLPIYKLLKQENDLLNNEMNEFLSEKQLKKWKKYNKNLFPIIE